MLINCVEFRGEAIFTYTHTTVTTTTLSLKTAATTIETEMQKYIKL